MHVEVDLGRAISPTQWAHRHAAGEVPSVVPYGLDLLTGTGLTPSFTEPRRSTVLKLPAGAARRLTGGHEWVEQLVRPRDARAADVRLFWDERTSVPALRYAGRGAPPVSTGVIWATDEARGGRAAALRRAAREQLRRATSVWVLSSGQLPHLVEGIGVPAGRTHHVLFGVDEQFWTPAPEPGPVATVLAVGNDRDRDHDTMLRGVLPVLLPDAGEQVVLVTTQPHAVPPALGRRIVALDHRSLREQYQQAAVVVVCCRENLHVSGMTAMLEAQSCGVPVVATRWPGVSDYLQDGVSGFLVDPGDPAAVGARVRELLDDPDRARAMGAAGRAFVVHGRSTTTMARALHDVVTAAER